MSLGIFKGRINEPFNDVINSDNQLFLMENKFCPKEKKGGERRKISKLPQIFAKNFSTFSYKFEGFYYFRYKFLNKNVLLFPDLSQF